MLRCSGCGKCYRNLQAHLGVARSHDCLARIPRAEHKTHQRQQGRVQGAAAAAAAAAAPAQALARRPRPAASAKRSLGDEQLEGETQLDGTDGAGPAQKRWRGTAVDLDMADTGSDGGATPPASPQASQAGGSPGSSGAGAAAAAGRPAVRLTASALATDVLLPPAVAAPASAGVEVQQRLPVLPGQRLSRVEKLSLQLMPRLPARQLDATLREFKLGNPDMRFGSRQELREFLVDHTGLEMEKVKTCTFDGAAIYHFRLKDPLEAVKRLVQRAQEHGGIEVTSEELWKGGVRYLGRMEYSDELRRIGTSIFSGRPPRADEGILPLVWWSDKGVVRLGGRSYHPANLVLITQSRGTVFKQAFYIRLGYLPVMSKEVAKRHRKPLSDVLLHSALEDMTAALKDAAARGAWVASRLGELQKLWPVPVGIMADIQEMAALTLTSGSKRSAYPDPSSLDCAQAPGGSLAASKRMAKARGWSVSLFASPEQLFGKEVAARSSFQRDQPLLRRPGLAGWPHADVFSLDSPDALHLIDEGLFFYLLRHSSPSSLLSKLLKRMDGKRAAAALRTMNGYLRRWCPSWLDDRMPSGELGCTETSGNRFAYMARCAAPALLTVTGLEDLAKLLTALCSWEALVRREIHTQSSIQDMADARIRFQEMAQELFPEDWRDTLKTYRMHMFERWAPKLAARLSNTDTQERSMKDHKPSDARTNGHPGAHTDQFVSHATLAAAAREVLDISERAAAAEKARARRSVSQRALERNAAWLPKNSGTRVRAAELANGSVTTDAAATALLRSRPELQHLPYSLEANDISVAQVTVFDAMGFPYVRYPGCPAIGITLRADPSWRSRPVFHWVAVRSAAGGLWFGQLLALVDTAASHRARAENGSNLWAFVRWLENAPETRASGVLAMTRLRWCSHPRRINGRREVVPYYDLVQLGAIAGPVCIVPDETPGATEGQFFYNHHVR